MFDKPAKQMLFILLIILSLDSKDLVSMAERPCVICDIALSYKEKEIKGN